MAGILVNAWAVGDETAMIDCKSPLTPPGIAAPFGAYSHGIAAPAGRLIVTSGQLGLNADGSCPADFSAQARLCLEAIDAILAEAGAGRAQVLRLNAYVTRREDFAAWMEARDIWLHDITVKPASTLMIVSGFTRAEFLVEVEALAVAPDGPPSMKSGPNLEVPFDSLQMTSVIEPAKAPSSMPYICGKGRPRSMTSDGCSATGFHTARPAAMAGST